VLVTLEGTDGAGKSTQTARLLDRLRAAGYAPVAVHEPGGTSLGAEVRPLLLKNQGSPIHPWAEAFLFSACRAELVYQVIRPALERRGIVVADRFADSTLAYQGAGRGLPRSDLESLVRIATGGLVPDLTILLDLPGRDGLARRALALAPASVASTSVPEEGAGWNRFEDEGEAFQERVRAAFLEMASGEPSRWVVLDAREPPDMLAEAVWEAVEPRLPRRV
jgi:dTMP kinase